ncbi:LytR/AlgR family response regulator transcription factor [Portibacter lacus]|uniref:DNA-binding response regulator n=1 Tax=Portibacter lacus TaxID=1099794 RepID=A0AA37SPH5_9BACT|nr:response regulator transcription factor [Portibacter lacus]GLR16353.1 DNA-binding response regulator [Portibacter lacus]
MELITAAIIEDEIRNQQLLSHMISNSCPEINIIGVLEGVQESIDFIKEQKPEIIFLDIQLKDGSGFDILNALEEKDQPKIIFTTAYDQYAIDAFRYSAVNYLLKPIDDDELISSVKKVVETKGKVQLSNIRNLLTKMMVDSEEQLIAISGTSTTEYIRISEIIHIKAMGAYSQIFLRNGDCHTVSKVIKIYDEMLSKFNFFRTHQSHLINLKCVRKYIKGDNIAVLVNGDEAIISRNKKDKFVMAMDKMTLS